MPEFVKNHKIGGRTGPMFESITVSRFIEHVRFVHKMSVSSCAVRLIGVHPVSVRLTWRGIRCEPIMHPHSYSRLNRVLTEPGRMVSIYIDHTYHKISAQIIL
jgi:hypothetical protein